MMSTSIVLKQNRCNKKVYNPLVEPVLATGGGYNPLYACVLGCISSAIPNKLCSVMLALPTLSLEFSRVVLALPITIPSPLGVGCVVTHRKSLEGGYKTQHARLGVANTSMEGGYKTC